MDKNELSRLACELHCDHYPSCGCDMIEVCVPKLLVKVELHRCAESAKRQLAEALAELKGSCQCDVRGLPSTRGSRLKDP